MIIKNNYGHTIRASYIGYITQAIINNFAPLLFLTFQREPYNIPLGQITLLVSLNFAAQLIVDALAVKFADYIGYKPLAVTAHICAASGLAGLAFLPGIMPSPFSGLLASVIIYAIGGGLIEVLISPIVEACPTEESKKSSVMSLLHSFYCWGLVFVIIASTLFFVFFGIENWRILACLWAVIPSFNAFYFSRVTVFTLTAKEESMSVGKLASSKLFWILIILMVCSGASEQAMIQWASVFAEAGLKISKTMGDLAGACLFAVLMGISRVFYAKFSEKINLRKFILRSGILCAVSYTLASLSPNPVISLIGCALCGLSVGIMWPGTFSIAARTCPKGGTALFALLALGGDLGCSAGPAVVGFVSGITGGDVKTGILSGIIFPLVLILCIASLSKIREKPG
ncbi:MAG: MFS transporter [Oscillospiraceae bacterium]|nr:MFS transporter [Oscillospiraceae bacterium]